VPSDIVEFINQAAPGSLAAQPVEAITESPRDRLRLRFTGQLGQCIGETLCLSVSYI